MYDGFFLVCYMAFLYIKIARNNNTAAMSYMYYTYLTLSLRPMCCTCSCRIHDYPLFFSADDGLIVGTSTYD